MKNYVHTKNIDEWHMVVDHLQRLGFVGGKAFMDVPGRYFNITTEGNTIEGSFRDIPSIFNLANNLEEFFVWAKERRKSHVKIGDYEVKRDGDTFSIGCSTLTTDDIQKIVDASNVLNKINENISIGQDVIFIGEDDVYEIKELFHKLMAMEG